MNPPSTDSDELIDDLIATAESMGQAMSPRAAALIADDLAAVPLGAAREALQRVRGNYKGRLTYAVIREYLLKLDGRPDREEAWSMALQAVDERASVVWTREVQLAMEAARPALRIGDKVGARMAFLEVYDRLLAAARTAMQPAQWALSAGWDGELRQLALEQAVQFGRLSNQAAGLLGYQPGAPLGLSADARAIVGLLAAPTPTAHLLAVCNDPQTRTALEQDKPAPELKDVSPGLRERLHCLAQALRDGKKIAEIERRRRLEGDLRELEQRRQHAQAAVAAHQSPSKGGR